MSPLASSVLACASDLQVVIADIGAQGKPPPEWRGFEALTQIVGFEPLANRCEELRRHYPENEYIQRALWRHAGEIDFHITPSDDYSSILRPDPDVFALVGRRHVVEPYKIQRINVETLDSNLAERTIDLIKLDTQGSELAILEGGSATLANALAVLTEISFLELYEGQPLFADVDIFLRRAGYQFLAFTDMIFARSDTALKHKARTARFVGGNALYVRVKSGAHLKLALIEAVYGFPDLAASREIDGSIKTALLSLAQRSAPKRIPARAALVSALWKGIGMFDIRPHTNLAKLSRRLRSP